MACGGRVPERNRELQEAIAALQQSQKMLAKELEAAEQLQYVVTQLITARGTEALYEQILDTATVLLHADFATIQQSSPERGAHGELRLLGHRGFNAEAAMRWEWVARTAHTICAEALRIEKKVVVPDIRKCDFIAGREDMDRYLAAGIHAGFTTPLTSRSGALIGMVSTYWREPHELSSTELRSMDVLSRLAADLIERSQAEEALRRSEERFRNMADTAPMMIWMTGPDKLCSFVNNRWLDFVGHSIEQELGYGWVDSLHPEDRDRSIRNYALSFEARQSFQTEFRARRADGEYRWFLAKGTPHYRDGEFVGYIGCCIDITEHRLIEERLCGSETRLKNAQRLAKVGSFERNVEDDSAYWSDEMFRIYGLANGTPPSTTGFLNCVYPEDRPRLLEAHRQVRSSDAPVEIEFRIVRPDGEVRWARSVLEAVRDDRGAVVHMTGATQDVTDLVRAREESVARQKLESVGTLASGIAHDFNNILGGILAQTELAQLDSAAGGSPDEELKAVRKLAIRGSEIVRQLMIYAGKDVEVYYHIDLSQVVEEMLALLKVSVSKHAVLETGLANDLPPLRGSAAQLRQLVMNLVTNASEALGDQDGVIRVTTGRVSMNADEIREIAKTGEYVQLEVSDSGCGMPPETQARVFDPFFTTKSTGRGLGLSVVDGIVRNFGGLIQLTSHPGKGTSFRILLPCAERTTETNADSIQRAKDQTHPCADGTVLVVDDEGPLREGLVKMLRQEGYTVLEAASGTAAMDLLRGNGAKIDFILLDMTMPGSSTHDVVSQATQGRPELKVILTSAYGAEMATGICGPQIRGFLRKPFLFEDLMRTLQNASS